MTNVESVLANKPNYLIAFVQSMAVVLYVGGFILAANQFGPMIGQSTSLIVPMVFLLTFVTSALICGSLMLGYPTLLVFKGRIGEAVTNLFWGITWLLIILLILITITLIIK